MRSKSNPWVDKSIQCIERDDNSNGIGDLLDLSRKLDDLGITINLEATKNGIKIEIDKLKGKL